MRVAATSPTGLAARWVLLVCTLLGLAAMHTIGHTGPGGGGHSAAVTGMADLATVVSAPAPCPDGHCDGHGSMDSFSVCMAVLQGLGAAVLLALLLLAVLDGRGRIRPRARSVSGVPRAPPVHRTGLTIAATSVLRI